MLASAGQFIWTGTDYIGEPTPWHNQNQTPVKSSYFGIVDTAGIPKNDYYLYQSQWVSAQKKPMVHLLPHWNWEDSTLRENVADADGKIPVRAFSNAASVELFLNGESLGKKPLTRNKLVMAVLTKKVPMRMNFTLNGRLLLNQVH